MSYAKHNYMNLESLAIELSLPKSFLRELAKKKSIPALNVNGRLRFNPGAVQRALDNFASTEGAASE